MRRRSLAIQDYRAGQYFRRLLNLFGEDGVERRLATIDRHIKAASGVYLRDWVIPRSSWWLGFGEAIDVIKRHGSFRRSVTRIMERPLQTAVKLSALYRTFTESKRDEIRSRMLADDVIEPILFEIDSAAHFLQLGYEIEWFQVDTSSGKQSPEFIARYEGNEIEVECKSKQADSGRRIDRATFYRFVDLLIPIIESKELSGVILLEVPSRLPKQTSWFKEAQQALEDHAAPGEGAITLSGDEAFTYKLKSADGSAIHINDLFSMVDPIANPYSHFAYAGQRVDDLVTNPIVFRLDSSKQDEFLDNVLESLRGGQEQFSGTRSALLSCMIPEIDSFEGLESNSAIQYMTYHFFEKYSYEFVNAVTYVSELVREEQSGVIDSDMPSLTFRNHKYNDEYGPDIPVY